MNFFTRLGENKLYTDNLWWKSLYDWKSLKANFKFHLLWSLVLAFMVSWSGGSSSLWVTTPLGSQESAVLVTPPLLLGSLASWVLVIPPQGCRESLVFGMLVTPPLVCGRSQASVLLAGDNSGLWGELISTSAVGGDSCSLESELVGDSSSLVMWRGIDMLLSVFTWGLLWRQLKAVSL